MAGMVMDHKKVLGQLVALTDREETCIPQIYTDEKAFADPNSNLSKLRKQLEATRQKSDEKFIVLVIGAFSSGKSSMINALIGEELLPTGFLPETAVLGELHYSENKRITLYPKKGMWEGGDEPFDLRETTAEEISKYASLTADDAINNMEGESENRIESRFEKMVIHWPLEMLKDGVVLVDSPGINDPYSNDYIVNGYLPRADAIIYVMDAQHAYQGTDVKQLTAINEIGLRNIITGYTFYDIVQQQNRRKPEALEKIRSTLIKHMENHSDLKEPSIHFLSSMDALDGKLDHDPELVRKSGYEGLESYLSRYLVEGKGRDQVRNMATTIIKQANIMIKDAENFNLAASQEKDQIRKNAEMAERQLADVRNNVMSMSASFRRYLESYLPKARGMVEECIRDLAHQVDLENFDPETTLPDGLRKLNFVENKKRAKQLQAECQQELESRMNITFRKWSNEVLGEYLKQAVCESTRAIKPGLEQMSRELGDITSTVINGTPQSSSNMAVGNDIAIGLAYAILSGDWFTGGMSAIYGKGAMARGIAFQAAAGVGLGLLMAAGVTISLPLVTVAAIGASVLSVITSNTGKKVEKIKTQAVKDLRKSYGGADSTESILTMTDNVMEGIESFFEGACDDIDAALKQDVWNTENSIQQILEESQLDEEDKLRQCETRREAIESLRNVQQEALGYCQQYGIEVNMDQK